MKHDRAELWLSIALLFLMAVAVAALMVIASW